MYKIAANISRHSLDAARDVWLKVQKEKLVIDSNAQQLLVIADSLEDAYSGAVFASMRGDNVSLPAFWLSPDGGKTQEYGSLQEMLNETAAELRNRESRRLRILQRKLS